MASPGDNMEWWYVHCPMHRCSEDMFGCSENACWAWLQYHLISSTRGLVPHPGDDEDAMDKAMQNSPVRFCNAKLWSDWQKEKENKEKGESSSNVEMPELYEDNEEETESNKNRSSLEVDFIQLHRHRLQRGQTMKRHLPQQKSSTRLI